jgi:hypothetical protein
VKNEHFLGTYETFELSPMCCGQIDWVRDTLPFMKERGDHRGDQLLEPSQHQFSESARRFSAARSQGPRP